MSAPRSASKTPPPPLTGPGDTWHLDDVLLAIHSERHCLWHAVDQDGTVLEILVPRRRERIAAKAVFRRLLNSCPHVPRVIVTDHLESYRAAKREVLPGVEHRQHGHLNNRAEHSHQPPRQRERRLQGFKSAGHAQGLLAAYDPIAPYVRPHRPRLSAPASRQERRHRFDPRQDLTTFSPAA